MHAEDHEESRHPTTPLSSRPDANHKNTTPSTPRGDRPRHLQPPSARPDPFASSNVITVFPDRVPHCRFVTAWLHAFRIKQRARAFGRTLAPHAPLVHALHRKVRIIFLHCRPGRYHSLFVFATCVLGLGQKKNALLSSDWYRSFFQPLPSRRSQKTRDDFPPFHVDPQRMAEDLAARGAWSVLTLMPHPVCAE